MSAIGNSGPKGRQSLVGATARMSLVEPVGEEGGTNERDLLRRASERDEHAVRALYRLHVGRVYRHVARILGPSDPEIDDVVQHVFLAALDGAARFDGRSSVGTWILGIATRRALDEARSRWRRSRWERVREMVGIGRPAARPDVRHIAADEAQAALDRLNPDQRTVFLLHEVEGHTLQEIHAMTGVGISTLHARLKAARRRLDDAIAELGSRPLRMEGEDDGSAA